MTCIVGLVDKKNVWMGCDSAGVANWTLIIRSDKKVFRNGPYLLGFTESFRMGQLLQYTFKPPSYAGNNIHRFIATTFVDAVRELLSKGGVSTKINNEERGGTFLIGFRGTLLKIYSDYQVQESSDHWDACGSGEDTAHGSLFTSRTWSPRKRILTALRAAEHSNVGVRGPFRVYCLKKER